MRTLSFVAFAVVGLTLSLGAGGCGEDFAPPSEVHGLRVLAVRSEPASGSPGATVKLHMLLADSSTIGSNAADGAGGAGETGAAGDSSASDDSAKPTVLWLAGCNNPPGRQYFGCLPGMRELAAEQMQAPSASSSQPQTEFEFVLPDDILSSAPKLATDPIHYGVSYVFFAVCAGELGYRPDITDGIPIGCTNHGEPVDASGFVTGFSTIYTYEGEVNQSPLLTSVTFDGEVMPAAFPDSPLPTCESDADCAGDFRHQRVCTEDTRTCAPVIGACSGPSCPPIRVAPQVDPSSVELYTGGHEIMWASYYATSGALSSPTRLVVDRTNGPTNDSSVTWLMPPQPTTSRIWVTINDQRGGATWAFFDIAVK